MRILRTSAEIRQCADELIQYLKKNYKDASGSAWTDGNFLCLEKFINRKDPNLKSYYRNKDEKAEFLWDFIASSPQTGIFLAAESEQAVYTSEHRKNLKHDFEKLLYVYAPIRLLISKAESRERAQNLADELADYAETCCLNFNPGSVFILHFGLWNDARNANESVSYIWQSKCEPRKLTLEKLDFAFVASDELRSG